MFQLKCCGVVNYTDWKTYSYNKGKGVSKGCCRNPKEEPDCYTNFFAHITKKTIKRIYTKGCYYAMKDKFSGAVIGLGITVLILVVIQVSS